MSFERVLEGLKIVKNLVRSPDDIHSFLVVQVVKVGKFLFGQSDGRATCVMEGEVTG